ncbi:MAG TPA: phosphoribosylaminoimidazolesuccinocarboxamide synthase [Trebonia sp.]|nr:phosphoribosylaminoimidazolesuccinocarboxamide synthase [Trebonia sp.]
MPARDIITDLTDLSCPLPEEPEEFADEDEAAGWRAMADAAADDREKYEQNLRLSWERIDGHDPLLNAIETARSAMLKAEARMRLLVAYGREYVHPRPYRLEDLARAAGMSISGVRTAYGEDEVAEVARLTGARPRRIEGKTKVIEDVGGGEVLIRGKDDITAGDGAKHDVLDGKAAASTRTTCNVFQLLERNGIPTHFVGCVDDVTFLARNVEMIPLELVVRRYAAGSYRDRFPDLPDGAVLDELAFEIFEKDDAAHDPLLEFDFEAGVLRRHVPNSKAAEAIGPGVKAGDLVNEEPIGDSRYAGVSPELIAQLRSRAVSAFELIEKAWLEHGGVYIDFKIECGIDRETGELLIADVIDSDSGRLRFGEVDMSKQSYRDGTATLPEIRKKFDEVAALTDRFVP